MAPHDPTYAIGDVHGCYDLLVRLLDDIHRDAERRGRAARMVFLGDYIDRGPGSKDVLAILMAGPQRAGDQWICLTGNHEELMLQASTSESSAAHWLRQGGGETLASFGGKIPDDVSAWCGALPAMFDDGLRLFAHAGLRPGVPIDGQQRRDLLWIRDEFLLSSADHGRLVVHGHTPDLAGPTIRPNRINLDTGAYLTGVLTAAVFVGARYDFIQAKRA
jgi:serine/threonine protein phosphatase 1